MTIHLPSRLRHQPAEPPVRGRPRWWLVGGLLALLALAYAVDAVVMRGQLHGGAEVAGVPVGGLTRAEALGVLEREVAPDTRQPISGTAGGQPISVDPTRAGLEPDLASTVADVADAGRNPVNRLRGLFGRRTYPLRLRTDDSRLRAEVTRLAATVDRPVREGAVRFRGSTPYAVLPQPGRRLDVQSTVAALRSEYVRAPGGRAPVELKVEVVEPQTDDEDVRRALEQVARPAVAAPLTLRGAGRRVVFRPRAIAGALRLEAAGTDIVPAVDVARLSGPLAPMRTKAKDARFAVRGKRIRIVPAVPARRVDSAELARRMLPALVARGRDRTVAVPFIEQQPKFTTADARALEIREHLGSFTTAYPCCRPRVRNIHRIAALVDGAIVKAGATFSLNQHVGPRTRAKGFVKAPMILEGDFVKAVGGGVSQFATTMFNAAFFSGVPILEHKPHTYYISRYPAGREATVSWRDPDLVWRNDTRHAVLIKTKVTDTTVTVLFFGTRHYDRVESRSGPRTRVRDTDEVKYESGPDCEPHEGGPGFDIVVWRVLHRGGDVRRERFFTRYLPDPKVVCR